MSAEISFEKFAQQLFRELHALSTESKRRNSDIKHASDTSQEILKVVNSFDELLRHPDFVLPFVLSCASRNAKLTSISMQCLQRLASIRSIPDERMEDVLNAFMESTHLAVEIQLKVLQIIPIFFKTYSNAITGELCSKLLKCCSSLLQLPNKAPMVVGTASATLQQLVNDILDRASTPQEIATIEVAVSNTDYTTVGTFRYDANRLFFDLCSLKSGSYAKQGSVLNIEGVPEDYGLEILESVLSNHFELFEYCADLQFILRTKAVPLFLRSISSSKDFPIVVRSARCLVMLIRLEFLKVLELELEIILFLLIKIMSNEIDSPAWKKIIILEIFQLITKNIALILAIFQCYDMNTNRKQIMKSLVDVLQNLISSNEYQNYLKVSHVLTKGDTPVISQENSAAKIPLIELLDKSGPPMIDQTYGVFLVLSITNQISDEIGSYAVTTSQKERAESSTKVLQLYFNSVFPGLFFLHKMFLYSTTLDTPLFHAVIRAFQKLSHSSGILELNDKLSQCLDLFGIVTVEGCLLSSSVLAANNSEQDVSPATAMLNTISGSLIRTSNSSKETSDESHFTTRTVHPRMISVFRALISLSISLGSYFTSEHWSSFLKTWQWMSYYLKGPSGDHGRSGPGFSHNTQSLSSDLNAVQASIGRFCESTQNYPGSSFHCLVQSLIQESSKCLTLAKSREESAGYRPTTEQGKLTNCAYNKDFFMLQLGELSRLNILGLFKGSKEDTTWDLVVNYLVTEAASRNYESEVLRLCSVDVLNAIVAEAARVAGELGPDSKSEAEMIEDKLLIALTELAGKIMGLGRNREALHRGSIETECDIVFQMLRTLKGLLDVFGESLTASWDTVFRIINSPFELINKDHSDDSSIFEEDSSILDVISSKHKGMIQVSFDVFKLIFDDFLQTLPPGVLEDVIDTLLNFVRQDRDLNISFSSISQFWLIGDFLRTCVSRHSERFSDIERREFIKDVEQGKLISLISSADDHPYSLFNGLWLYLLKKLVECTNDPRVEVKNGAIQTFFRIVDSYSASFPPWELLIQEVLKPLLEKRFEFDEYLRGTEFINLTLKGLVQMYSMYFAAFSSNENLARAWELLVSYMEDLIKLPSFEISFIVLNNFKSLLDAMVKIPEIPDSIILELYETWCGYNVVYTDSSKPSEFNRKTNYECIEELLSCYPPLHQILSRKHLLDSDRVEAILTVMNSAARYPLLPEFSSDDQKPSSLQQAVLESVQVFEFGQPLEIEVLILNQISTLIALPFETKSRIENKLGPRLSLASRKRIPTFEAISYEVCEYLGRRLKSTEVLDADFICSKRLPKLLKNLSLPVLCKSLIENRRENSVALWTLASQCFYSLAEKILSALKDPNVANVVPEKAKEVFFELFIDVAVTPLKRIDPETDILTEVSDIEEFERYRDILLQNLGPAFPETTHVEKFVSAVWSGSFFHEVDDVEDAIIKESDSLFEVAVKLADFPFDEVLGSTREQSLLSKYKTASLCLRDLMEFTKYEGPGQEILRPVCVPFMVARYAFILRRYISDVILLNRKPIAKDRKMEVVLVLTGLKEVLDSVSKSENSSGREETIEHLKALYPLVLKTIPASHKIVGLQAIVQELSLEFTKLIK
ncbi:LAME_0F19460g1_1 [Lachancea meyersii CBS 8951]|uniref:LAME_0F19460g1_1 n=1 Tax=Lachancea meyersii CBS 8951 TaxID=1266667 RepID=A0A1G4K1F3_9SACH|nr:LAME_0F19460g1_1 [Lachancea meyersii CBS 8951]